MTREQAVEVIARGLLAKAARDASWDDHVHLGMADWMAVRAEAARIAGMVSGAEVRLACRVLDRPAA